MCPNEPVIIIFIFLFFVTAKVSSNKETDVAKSIVVVAKSTVNVYQHTF
jgi:hypothetical protein